MDKDLKKVIDKMTNNELAAFILNEVCREFVKKDTDVIEVISGCICILRLINNNCKGMSTRLYKILNIIMKNLKHVADDGGYLKIDIYKKSSVKN